MGERGSAKGVAGPLDKVGRRLPISGIRMSHAANSDRTGSARSLVFGDNGECLFIRPNAPK